MLLADTNILLRFTNDNDADHPLVSRAVRELLDHGELLCYTQQNRREFWNVGTRPADRGGLGYAPEEVQQFLDRLDSLIQRLPDTAENGAIWDRLVLQYGVRGVAVHDAQLVASMLAHGIPAILTLNDADFRRYGAEITVVHPRDIGPASQEPQS